MTVAEIDERQVRHAVRDHLQLAGVDVVAANEQICGGARHHDGRLGGVDEISQHGTLMRGRLGEDGVQRHDGRDAQRASEVQHVLAIVAAPDAVLVLDRDDVDAAIERLGGPQVVGAFVLADPVSDFRGVGQGRAARMQDGDLTAAGRCGKVAGERRDPATAGEVRRDECGTDDDGSPSRATARRGPGERTQERSRK